jgi:hypothetical protein
LKKSWTISTNLIPLILHFSSLPRYNTSCSCRAHYNACTYISNNKDLLEFRIQGAPLKGKLNFERLAKLW